MEAEFESALQKLLRKLGFQVILDYGAGEEDARVVDSLVAAFAGSSIHLARAFDSGAADADLATVRGSLGAFAASIEMVDVFIGYDSAPTHVAAAIEVPIIEVLVGAPNELYGKRWAPYGPESVCVIPADDPEDSGRVLTRIENELTTIREQGGRFGQLKLGRA